MNTIMSMLPSCRPRTARPPAAPPLPFFTFSSTVHPLSLTQTLRHPKFTAARFPLKPLLGIPVYPVRPTTHTTTIMSSHPEKIGSKPGQIGLLKRSPTVSRDDFQAGWQDHAAAGLPWALAKGVQLYVQIYNVRPSVFGRANPDELTSFDGATELVFDPPEGRGPPVLDKFHQAWVVPDKKRFLLDTTQKVTVFADRRLVEDKRHVLVEGGSRWWS